MQIVQGPPGTGKTHMIVQQVCPLLAAKVPVPGAITILVSAPSNHGVDDLAAGLDRKLRKLQKDKVPGTANKYVLRLHSRKTEFQICLSKIPVDVESKSCSYSSPKVVQANSPNSSRPRTQKTTNSDQKDSDKVEDLLRDLALGDTPIFDGIHDTRLQNIKLSVGHRMLTISGVISKEDFTDPDKEKYAIFRALRGKYLEGRTLTREQSLRWTFECEKLYEVAIKRASAIVGTTAQISSSSLLDFVVNTVAAIFLDEGAFEREPALLLCLQLRSRCILAF